MKPFARINLSSVALGRGILVSSLAREGSGKCCQCGNVANTNNQSLIRMPCSVLLALAIMIVMSCLCVLFELADVAKNWPWLVWDTDVMSSVWIVSAVAFALSIVMICLRKRWLSCISQVAATIYALFCWAHSYAPSEIDGVWVLIQLGVIALIVSCHILPLIPLFHPSAVKYFGYNSGSYQTSINPVNPVNEKPTERSDNAN